jgi:hypothetical protein
MFGLIKRDRVVQGLLAGADVDQALALYITRQIFDLPSQGAARRFLLRHGKRLARGRGSAGEPSQDQQESDSERQR